MLFRSRTPQPISHLQDQMPEVYNQFVKIAQSLEDHYRDMQDMEFTIEGGKLYMLQTRNGKRTAPAALKIAVDLVNEGKLTKEEAILKEMCIRDRQGAAKKAKGVLPAKRACGNEFALSDVRRQI